jgi:RNA polymerase sigma-70 factor (family 1)
MIENTHIKTSEADLLHRIQQGDESAFASLFYAYKDKLYGFILGITHSEARAEDILQDVFLKIWQHKTSISEITNFNAYLYRLAQNQAIDELRKFSKETCSLSAIFSLEEDLATPDPVEILINKEIKSKIEEAVNQLPPQQKKIFTLHKEQGFQHEEIAQQLNLSVSTIQNHMRLALGNLRTYLSHSYPGLFLFTMVISKTINNYF